MWITSMGNHGAAGVSQNAGILVVLVRSVVKEHPTWENTKFSGRFIEVSLYFWNFCHNLQGPMS